MTIKDALDYEVRSAWWPALCSRGWMQKWAARYFGWKVRRKWARYAASLREADRVAANRRAEGC